MHTLEEFMQKFPTAWPTLGRIFRKTQTECAELSGLERANISRIWSGKVTPNQSTTIALLAKALPVRSTWIAGLAGDLRSIDDRHGALRDLDRSLAVADQLESLRADMVQTLTDKPHPKIGWRPEDHVWLAWMILRAYCYCQSVVEAWDADRAEAAQAYASKTIDAAGWSALITALQEWHAAINRRAIIEPVPEPDLAWSVVMAGWGRLDLADRARVADLVQRLAQR